MKIYAITKGIYSDYHICALTTSRSKAKRLQKIYSDRYDDADIEEYEDGGGVSSFGNGEFYSWKNEHTGKQIDERNLKWISYNDLINKMKG